MAEIVIDALEVAKVGIKELFDLQQAKTNKKKGETEFVSVSDLRSEQYWNVLYADTCKIFEALERSLLDRVDSLTLEEEIGVAKVLEKAGIASAEELEEFISTYKTLLEQYKAETKKIIAERDATREEGARLREQMKLASERLEELQRQVTRGVDQPTRKSLIEAMDDRDQLRREVTELRKNKEATDAMLDELHRKLKEQEQHAEDDTVRDSKEDQTQTKKKVTSQENVPKEKALLE